MLEWGLKDGGLKDGDGTSSSKKTAVSKSPFTLPTTKIAQKIRQVPRGNQSSNPYFSGAMLLLGRFIKQSAIFVGLIKAEGPNASLNPLKTHLFAWKNNGGLRSVSYSTRFKNQIPAKCLNLSILISPEV